LTNVGSAGTFVIRKAVSQATLRAELRRRFPFQTELMTCSSGDILRLAASNPFAGQPARRDVVRFVSVLAKRGQSSSPIPFSLPSAGRWSLKVLPCQGRFVVGLYRRDMKAIR
jgi:hypothetical protein